jgi:glycosyltransferase involved in cell wall biosynthesis
MEAGCVVATAWGSDVVPPPGEQLPSRELVQARIELIRRAAAVTVCGPTFAETVADFAGIPRNRIDVVPFGVDVELFKPRTEALHGRRPFRVGFFKGFRDVYGPTYLVQAIPGVLAACPETRFDFVGDGPRLTTCQRMAEELGVSSTMRWLPRQAHHDLPPILREWRLSVIPSLQEAFGVAALESSAMGVPVVASDVGGLRDTVVHDGTGLLVPPASPQALAAGITSLLQHLDTRRRMARAGRIRVVERFNMPQVLGDWETLYERARERIHVMV